jgi:cytochrome c-type biogenesis protein CcmH
MSSKIRGLTEHSFVALCGSLRLCGEIRGESIDHRDTEISQRSTKSRAWKYLKSSIFVIATAVGLLFWSPQGISAKEAQPAEDPQIAQRMKNLTQQLRCLVCQNETLADSQADLAEDLRREIREQMKAGKTDQEILAYLTQRYGDFVLYKPPVKATTYLLWFGPFLLLLTGMMLLFQYVRRRKELIPDEPLTSDERKQAEQLLRT